MSRIKLDSDSLGWSSLLERLTGTHVKDCFKEDEMIYFVVHPGELGKAVGRAGMMVKRVQDELGKRIKVIEYRESAIEFVKNVIYPLSVEEIIEESASIILRDTNKKTKSLLIGRDGKNLHVINRAVQRFFNKEVKVI